jgi:hypothetical protein
MEADGYEFDILVNAYMKDMSRASSKQSSVNLAYSAMNAGIVALPHACRVLGIPLFVGIIVINALVAYYLSNTVVKMAEDHSLPTLEDLGGKAFGKTGFVAMCCAQILFCTALMIGSFLIWGDTIPAVIYDNFDTDLGQIFFNVESKEDDEESRDGSATHGSYWQTNMCLDCMGITIIGALLVLPMCFQASMASLAWCSRLSVMAMVGGMMAVTVAIGAQFQGIDHTALRHSMSPNVNWWWTGVISINFCFFPIMQRALFVYSSLARRSPRRWEKATRRTLSTITIIFLIFGILGSYVDKCSEYINFFHEQPPHGDGVVQGTIDIFRCLVAIALLLTAPVHSLVAITCGRRLLRRLAAKGDGPGNDQTFVERLGSAASRPSIDDMSRTWFSEGELGYGEYLCGGFMTQLRYCFGCLDWFDDASDVDEDEEESMPVLLGGDTHQPPLMTTDYALMGDAGDVGYAGDAGGMNEEGGGRDSDMNPKSDRLAEREPLNEPLSPGAGAGAGADTNDLTRYRARTLSTQTLTSAGCATNASSIKSMVVRCLPQDWAGFTLVVGIWTFALILAVMIRIVAAWLLVGGSVVFTIASLVLPSMIYFRLGVSEDFQTIPVLASLDCKDGVGYLPNRIFMTLIQLVGLVTVTGCVVLAVVVLGNVHA